jgi:hypothetical protein
MNIDTIEEARDTKTNQLERFAYVVWNDGRKTRHKLTTLNVQAPQKVSRHESNLSRARVTNMIALDAAVLRATPVLPDLNYSWHERVLTHHSVFKTGDDGATNGS